MSARANLIFIIIFFGMIGNSSAFDSWEHKRLGDIAYHVALNVYCAKNPAAEICANRRNISQDADDASLQQFYDPFGNDVVERRDINEITYGDVVMCVDFFLTPDKLIAGRERSLINVGRGFSKVQSDEPPPPEEMPRLFPTRRVQLDIEYRTRCLDKIHNLEGARSSHVNHTHFQAELLVAQRHNHMIALSMRTMENNLFSALVMNAVSDHFLHDSFAPGHITTWRSRLTDLAANAYHDRVNRRGWPAASAKAELRTFLTVQDSSGNLHDLVPLVRGQLERRGSQSIKLHDEFFLPARGKSCPRNCRKFNQNATDYMPSLQEVLNKMDWASGAETGDSNEVEINLRGDGDLWRIEQDAQRFLMLLFEVRSILDVLESSSGTSDNSIRMTAYVVDSFKSNTWQWRYRDETIANGKSRAALLKLWEDLTWKPSVIRATIGPLSYEMKQESDLPFAKRSPGETLGYADMDQIFGISLGADNMVFGDAQTRYTANFETVVWGKATTGRSENYAVSVGVQPYVSRDYNGVALGARLIKVSPQIETSLSIPLRMVYLKSHNGQSKWKPSIGIRLDAGFTSFLTFYLQANYDSAVQKNGEFRSGTSLGAGIQLAAPKCRIPFMSNMCKD